MHLHALLQFKYSIIFLKNIFFYFRAQSDSSVLEVKTDTQAPCEATNKEGFFSRVESYSISFYTVA